MWWLSSPCAEIYASLHWGPWGSWLECNSGTAAGKRAESIRDREVMAAIMLLEAPAHFLHSLFLLYFHGGCGQQWRGCCVAQLLHSPSLTNSITVVLLLVGWPLLWWCQVLAVTGLPLGGSLGPPRWAGARGPCHRFCQLLTRHWQIQCGGGMGAWLAPHPSWNWQGCWRGQKVYYKCSCYSFSLR